MHLKKQKNLKRHSLKEGRAVSNYIDGGNYLQDGL